MADEIETQDNPVLFTFIKLEIDKFLMNYLTIQIYAGDFESEAKFYYRCKVNAWIKDLCDEHDGLEKEMEMRRRSKTPQLFEDNSDLEARIEHLKKMVRTRKDNYVGFEFHAQLKRVEQKNGMVELCLKIEDDALENFVTIKNQLTSKVFAITLV